MTTFWRTLCNWKDAGDLGCWKPRGARSEATEDKNPNFDCIVRGGKSWLFLSKRAPNFVTCPLSQDCFGEHRLLAASESPGGVVVKSFFFKATVEDQTF